MTLALLLGLAEGVVRLFWPLLAPEQAFERDESQSWVLPPGGKVELEGVENRINRLGYRGPEIGTRPGPCVARIYASGDSSVYGHGVPDGEAYVERLPGLLAGHLGLTFEAINGGVPGYSTLQSLVRLRRSGWALGPDLLVIGNLWSDAATAEAPDRLLFAAAAEARGTGEAVARALLSRSRLLQWGAAALARPEVDYGGGKPGKERVLRVPPTEYGRNLARMVEGARRRGAGAVLLILPHPSDLRARQHDPMVRRVRREMARRGHREIAQEYRLVMRRVARKQGAALLDTPALLADVEEPLFLDPLHPGAAGHARIAEHLARLIRTHPELLATRKKACQQAAP